MRQAYFTTTLLFFLIFFNSTANGQSISSQPQYDLIEVQKKTRYYYVKTKDNTFFTGTIIRRNEAEREITFQIYDNYEVVVLIKNIQSMRMIDRKLVKNGEYLFLDPSNSRYFILPTGSGMKQGQFQYKTTNLVYHSFHYGLTDRVSLHAGGELYTTMNLGKPAYHLGINLSYPINSRVKAGALLSYSNIYGDYKNLATGIGYLTFGDDYTNISTGLGYGYPTVSRDFQQALSFIPLNLKVRLNRSIALISENWLFLDTNNGFITPAFSYGARFIWEKYALDIALVNNKDIAKNYTFGFPMLNFSCNLKN